MFQPVNSNFQPKGDQPNAIKKIVENIRGGKKEQVLLGATGKLVAIDWFLALF